MAEQPDLGPTVLRMILGAQLRGLREALEITQETAGRHLRNSASKISRLEAGHTPLQPSVRRDVEDLLTLYGVHTTARRGAFLDLVERARQPGWWQRFSDVAPSWLQWYVGLEAGARSIRLYAPFLVPGLFQTEDYARAVITAGQVGDAPEDVERRVELRRRRQERLTGPGAPEVWAVIDETVLQRDVGGPKVMRPQLEWLITLSKLPNVALHVAPRQGAAFPHGGGAFILLRFGDPGLPDVVYLEELTTALYLDKRTDVDRYHQAMTWLSGQSSDPADAATILQQILEEGEADGTDAQRDARRGAGSGDLAQERGQQRPGRMRGAGGAA